MESLTVSSNYDLLHPDGINCSYDGNGSFQIKRPNALSNLKRVNFRAFKGELLPFTNIALPSLKAELVLMSNGLKSVTLDGNDTIDIPGVESYANDKHNVILSINKAWTYSEDEDSQVIANINEIIEIMNEKLKDYFKPVGYYMNTVDMTKTMSTNFFSYDYAFIPWANGAVTAVPETDPTKALVPYVSDGKIKFFDGSWLATDRLDYVETVKGKAIICRHRIEGSYDKIQYYVVDGTVCVSVGLETTALVNDVSELAMGQPHVSQRFFFRGGEWYDVLLYRTAYALLCEVHKFTINGALSSVETCMFNDFSTGTYTAAACDGLFLLGIIENTSLDYNGSLFFTFIYRNGEHFVPMTLESNLDLSTMTVTSQTTFQPFEPDVDVYRMDDLALARLATGST